MRSAALVGLIAGLLAVTTVLSPPIASVLGDLGFTFRFSRVYNRVFEVLLVIALALGWRRLDLGGPDAWGLRRAGWGSQLRIGVAIGLAGIGVAIVIAWLGGGLVPELRYDVVKTFRKASAGLVGALLVGVFEEVLFRGVLLRRFVLDLGPRAGLVLTTVVYAVVHGLRGGGKVTTSDWWAGWARTSTLFTPLGDAHVWPGIVGLFALGTIFAVLRQRTGSLWVPIGIHAAWVGVFRVGRLLFDIRKRPAWLVGPGWPPLVGGLAGVLAIATTMVLVRRFLARQHEERTLSP